MRSSRPRPPRISSFQGKPFGRAASTKKVASVRAQKGALASRLKRDEHLRELVRTGKATLPPPPASRSQRVRNEKRLLDEARHVFGDLSLVLVPAISVQLEFEKWSREHWERLPEWWPYVVNGPRRGRKGWIHEPLADLARRLGPDAVCPGSLSGRIRNLREIYELAGRQGRLEVRRQIESEMEAFGRALVTTLGHPKDVKDRSPRKPRPRRPNVVATSQRLAGKQREIERTRALVPGKAWNPEADAIKAVAKEDRVTSAAIRKRRTRSKK